VIQLAERGRAREDRGLAGGTSSATEGFKELESLRAADADDGNTWRREGQKKRKRESMRDSDKQSGGNNKREQDGICCVTCSALSAGQMKDGVLGVVLREIDSDWRISGEETAKKGRRRRTATGS
jgi:hypothetical protein